MAGQYLFQQGRTGARQTHDEYRIGRLATPTPALLKKRLRQGPNLANRLQDIDFGAVAMFDSPDAVAALIELERFVVSPAILQCFSECKGQM